MTTQPQPEDNFPTLPSPSQAPAAPSIPPVPDVWACDHPSFSAGGKCDLCGLDAWGKTVQNPPLQHDTEPVPRETDGETHPSRIRPLEDNVLLYLKPRPKRMAGSLIELPGNRAGRPTGAREAIVLATGPGWRLRGGRGPLVPTEVLPGQCVVVDAKAGQDWALDVGKPRTNPRGCAWESFPVPTELERVGGEYRMVRADEILFELVDQRPEAEAMELDYGELGERTSNKRSGWSR